MVESILVPARLALASYMRACGLEVQEIGGRISGQAPGGERVVADFDEAGTLLEIRRDSR
jgi:hypothetical protein